MNNGCWTAWKATGSFDPLTMPRLTACLVLFSLSCWLCAQDLIVTTQGDSINCSITTISSARLFYSQQIGDDIRRDNIALSNVALYSRKGYFPVILGNSSSPAVRKRKDEPSGRWQLGVEAGISRRIGEVPPDLDPMLEDHIEAQRNGLHVSGSIHYFIKEELALGVVYNSFFGAKHSMEITGTAEDGSTVTGILAEDVRMRWIPFSVLYAPRSQGRTSFQGSVGIGPLFYRNYAIILNNVLITGASAAMGASVRLQHRLTSTASIGLHVAYMAGSIDRFEYDFGSTKATISLPDAYNESVNRFDIGLNLRLRL